MKRLKIYGLVCSIFAVPVIAWLLIDALIPTGTGARKVAAIIATSAMLLWIQVVVHLIEKIRQ